MQAILKIKDALILEQSGIFLGEILRREPFDAVVISILNMMPRGEIDLVSVSLAASYLGCKDSEALSLLQELRDPVYLMHSFLVDRP
jgi:hypothetical protein